MLARVSLCGRFRVHVERIKEWFYVSLWTCECIRIYICMCVYLFQALSAALHWKAHLLVVGVLPSGLPPFTVPQSFAKLGGACSFLFKPRVSTRALALNERYGRAYLCEGQRALSLSLEPLDSSLSKLSKEREAERYCVFFCARDLKSERALKKIYVYIYIALKIQHRHTLQINPLFVSSHRPEGARAAPQGRLHDRDRRLRPLVLQHTFVL